MNLLQKVEIRGFRSLQQVDLDRLGHLTALVGRNSSGKSNILRALNLLFNGEVEAGNPIDFARDHFEKEPRIKKKKRISVAAEFSLPENFKFRPGLEHLRALGNQFRVRRSWELDERRNPLEILEFPDSHVDFSNEAEAARQFLSLVNYRYIPNRTVPANILREEGKAIADAILSRMKGDKHASAFLKSLSASAGRMLKDVGALFDQEDSLLSSPSLAIAESISEMLTVGGFQAMGPHGLEVADEDWGSGHQAFFLYSILHALDTSYGRFFGWRQATIWGVEEPESALHQDLATRLAGLLRYWAHESSLRLQIIQSTHSSTFTMASDHGYWLDVNEASTTMNGMAIPQLSSAAQAGGVSAWVHPILSYPWSPVFLVEGSTDVAVLSHVCARLGTDHLRFVTLPTLDEREGGSGKDNMIKCLRSYGSLLRNRPDRSPLVALFDWDASDQDLKKARAAYLPDSQINVVRMDPSFADPKVGGDFKGIERFYPPRIFHEAHEANELAIAVSSDGSLSISKSQLDLGKRLLLNRIRQISDPGQLGPLTRVIGQLESVLRPPGHQQLLFGDQSE